MSKHIGETTAYDKKLMLERKEPQKRSWDSLPSNHKRANFAFEILRTEHFARAKLEFAEGDFDSFGLVEGGGLLTNAGALLADKSPIRHSHVSCARWNGLTKSNGVMEALDDDEFSGGLLNLLDACQFESEKRGRSIVPQFRSSSSELHVILPNLNYEAHELQPLDGSNANGVGVGAEVSNNAISSTLTEGRNTKIIIRAIKANGHVTIVELCRKTHLSTSGVYKIIAALKKASMIRRIGPTKGGSWEVAE